MLLYAIRHGQSQTNALGYYPPIEGNPLTGKGFEDARHAGKLLEGLCFDSIYSSDLLRAVQTAQTAIPGCNPIQDKRLREADYGSLAGKSVKVCFEELGETFLENHTRRDFSLYRGESTHDQIVRIHSFMESVENSEENEQLAVFCHEGSIKSMLCVALGTEIDFRRVSLDNGSVSAFTYKNGVWKLVSWNRTL
ncbi:MAG: histidine phosphatase family protein [Sphaerochaetaceae bacterium]